MKQTALLIFYIAVSFNISAQSVELSVLRKAFHEAVLDSSKVESYHMMVKKIKNPSPVELAYQGASEALMAGVTWNPVKKYLRIKNFDNNLKDAIELDPYNIDIRFLRMAIQWHIPRVLGFSKNIEEDKDVILQEVSKLDRFIIDKGFFRYIIYLLKDSNICTPDQIHLIEQKLS